MPWSELPGVAGLSLGACVLALLTGAGTWLARRYALQRNLVDQPGERRSHAVATPRGGGIAIVLAMGVALCWIALADVAARPIAAAAFAGMVLVAGIGWIDDHRPLSPWLRLRVHALAAVVLALGVIASGAGILVALFAFAAAIILVNVWNFMDGVDGLATSQAALAAVGYALVAGGGIAWIAIALAASCVGFLPFNLPRARIFLGDVGSGALGFLLAAILAGHVRQMTVSMVVLALPLSAFLIDATLTLASRMLRGERWWEPHVQHSYQHWVRRVGGHGTVTTAYAGWTLVAVAIMLAVGPMGAWVKGATVGAWYLVGSIAWWGLRRNQQQHRDME